MSEWQLREFTRGRGAARSARGSWLLTAMLLTLLTMMIAAIGWASWATIEEVARASGRVVPSGRARIVESLEGGIVRAIHVAEGDTVSKGQPLVTIDDTSSSANLGEFLAQKSALQARSIRLDAEAAGAEGLRFAGSDIDPESALALREVELFASRLASYRGQRAVLSAQITQREQEIAEFEQSLPQIAHILALLDEELALRTRSGVVSRAQLLPLERERATKKQDYDATTGKLVQARAALAEAQARVTELDLQRSAEISSLRSETLNQLAVVEESIRRARDVVDRANLRAPVAGIVSALNVNTIGSVIAPAEEVLRIVPDNDRLQVDSRARPEDIAFLRADLPAKVKLTSFDFTIYGALDGTVTRVGADAEQDDATGEVYFPVIVETSDSTLTHAGKEFDIRPGMVASVDIMTGQHSVLDYLLKPFRKARLEALRER
ncbi:HlyD family type I secretion periplasmic adaptor subunit [Paracoccus sp. Z330]|uniref:Membrane fusion protein (MFP) family protein n=1 Tax=Paracoccus onchidii TaxID=3017813 RepID=A0ABT4ZH80_9RHOB|nr:HlyD family type I secretion periplasmic adaptor subunit [Paracoccus onchidii]MDB6178721.1 HlyD family type I secretion periplasmic adaptor subunit [Paracoccus onchidii]